MTDPKLSYPRIPTQVAIGLLREYDGKSAQELRELSDPGHLRAYFHPTHPFRVEVSQLEEIRDGVETIARGHGYPAAAKKGSSADFDRQTASFLVKEMQILPTEAAVEEVWNFITLVLLPHVALWRYPNKLGDYEYPRLLGKPRNVFRKLWWRAFVLGPALSEKLGEDETVGIMERSSIGGNMALSRAIVLAHDRVQTRYPGEYPATEFLREANKRIRAINSVRGLTFLPEQELQREIDLVFDEIRQAWDELWSGRATSGRHLKTF